MKTTLWVLGIIIVILICVGLYENGHSSMPSTSQTATSTPVTTALPEILPGIATETYTDPQYGFTIDYPATASLSSDNLDGFLPLTQTGVVGIALPKDLFTGTNLGEAGVYVGATTTPAIVANCMSASSEAGETAGTSTTIDGMPFAAFDSTGVGAGNIYDEHVYRMTMGNTCFEIAELLHSGNIQNYPTGSVTQFDKPQFQSYLEAIVRTFAFGNTASM